MSWLKDVAEVVLAHGGPATIARSLRRRQALILAYHNIVPDGERAAADVSLHLPRRDFARQLDLIARTHDVVPLQQLLETRRVADAGRRPLASLTFDDAYAGALTAGLEEIRSRGLPATIFVAPGLLGGKSFWWDEWAARGGDSKIFRELALTAMRGDQERIHAWAADSGVTRVGVPPHARSATLEDLKRAVKTGCVTLGAHSWSHRNLVRLDSSELRAEMERPLAWLRTHFTAAELVSCLAYPYGISSPTVEAAASRAEYSAALRVDGGHARLPLSSRHAAPRVNIPAGVSDNGMTLRLAGLV